VEGTQRKEDKNERYRNTGWVGRLPSLAQTAAAGGDEKEGVELEHSPESMGEDAAAPAGEEAKENRR
jgi:hypothetical protein